jgi:inner membrane protein
MTAPTHITFAEFVYLLILTTTGVSLNIVNTILIAVSSLLPDIDTAASLIGKTFPFISTRLERRFGHRTLTHSVIFIACMSVVSMPLLLFNTDLFSTFIVGYTSHPFLDTMTVNGVKLFYPFSTVKCVFPLEVNNPHRYRVQTGGKMDKTLAIIFLVGCIPTFVIALQGYERFIRSTQQNIESAVRDFNEFSIDHIVQANVIAYNMLTKEPLTGTVEIVGAVNPNTLIFKGTDKHLHSLGKSFQADYVAEKVLCNRWKPARSIITNVDLSNQLLSQITSYIDTSAENYFFGELTTTDKVSLPENIKLFCPISGSSNIIKFNFATYDDIRDFNLEYVFIAKGLLTIKSIITDSSVNVSQINNLIIPRPENYVQLSVVLNAKESINFLKNRGDTLRENELIAIKDLAQFFQEKIDLNQDKIQMLENQHTIAIMELNQKINTAEQAARIDSSDYFQNLILSQSGYVSTDILNVSELKWQKSRRILSQYIASKSALEAKTSHEIRKLTLSNAELMAKHKAAERQSEIRSTAYGVLLDVRQFQRNNKTQITFIIKKLK